MTSITTGLPVLEGITWDHPRGYDCLVASSELYKSLKNVEVRWTVRTLQDFADMSIQQLAQKYDLIILDHPHVGQIAHNHCLLDLPEMYTAEDSIGGSVESYYYEEKYWAYPVDTSCQMGVYRPDLISELALHWEDFFDKEAKKYKSITPLKPVDAFDTMLTLVASMGRKIPYSKDYFFEEDSGLFALKVLKSLYQLSPSEVVDYDPIKVLEILSSTNEFFYSPCLFGYVNYVRSKFRTHVLHYANLPIFNSINHKSRRSILGGAGMGVSANSKHPKLAIDFAKWVSSAEIQSGVYLENEGQPAHKSTWMKMSKDTTYKFFFDGAMDTMAGAWTRPRDEWFLGFVDEVCAIFPLFFLKNQSSESFLKKINLLYKKYLIKK